jgi:hypothetical protein
MGSDDDGGGDDEEELEAGIHLHYVQICTLRNQSGWLTAWGGNSQPLHSRAKAVLEEEGAF